MKDLGVVFGALVLLMLMLMVIGLAFRNPITVVVLGAVVYYLYRKGEQTGRGGVPHEPL